MSIWYPFLKGIGFLKKSNDGSFLELICKKNYPLSLSPRFISFFELILRIKSDINVNYFNADLFHLNIYTNIIIYYFLTTIIIAIKL